MASSTDNGEAECEANCLSVASSVTGSEPYLCCELDASNSDFCRAYKSPLDGGYGSTSMYGATYLSTTDCSSTLIVPVSPTPVPPDAISLTYASGSTSTINIITPWSDWDSYFSNTETSDCPITGCTLYESDCSTVMSSPISIGVSSPWDIFANIAIPAGYSETLCVECTNGSQTV